MNHIILWLWDGWRPVYGREHVAAMVKMLRAYLPHEVRILCITDMPSMHVGCEVFPLWKEPLYTPHSKPNCFRRLRIFDPATQAELSISPGDWVFSIDLDTVIMADLWPLLSMYKDASFVANAGAHSKYNGALWRFTAGTHTDIWTDFDYQTTPALLKRLRCSGGAQVGSDQAWLSHKIKAAPTWNTTHGLFYYSRHFQHVRQPGVLWNFAGGTKPWHPSVKINAPLVYQQYQRFL